MTAPLPTGADGKPVAMPTDYPFQSFPVLPLRPAIALRTIDLTDDEQALVSRLQAAVVSQRFVLELRDAYYRGEARIADLGIAIPPQLRALHVALGWPRVCVDALDERLDIEGFRYPGQPDVDQDLQDIWQANGMDAESHIANLDALVFSRGFVSVGAGEDFPLIAVESPLDFAVEYDARTRTVTNALRLYAGGKYATLYTRTATVQVELNNGEATVLSRDSHGLGVCPVVRVANRPRSYSRDGGSEISPEIMSITDSACRTLLGLEVAREFYSAPQRYILGASESAFQDASGNPKSAWDTYLGRVLALERDEEGNLPTVGQFAAFDPSAFTKIIDMYARIISAITGLPPHVLGYTTDNPASADAIRSAEMRHVRKADRKARMFGTAWRDVARLALAVRDGKPLDASTANITTVWAKTATPTPAATTDSLTKQIASGMIPATSTVTLEEAGYSATQIARLEEDRKTDAGTQFLAELAKSVIAKEARVDQSLAGDVASAPPTVQPGSEAAQ